MIKKAHTLKLISAIGVDKIVEIIFVDHNS